MMQEKAAFKFWEARGVLNYTCVDTGAHRYTAMAVQCRLCMFGCTAASYESPYMVQSVCSAMRTCLLLLPCCRAGATKAWGYPGPGVTEEQTKRCVVLLLCRHMHACPALAWPSPSAPLCGTWVGVSAAQRGWPPALQCADTWTRWTSLTRVTLMLS